MNTKNEIVKNWLPRYTGRPLAGFGKFILLSNFVSYIELFAARFGVEVLGRSHPMQSATADDITILNFGGHTCPPIRARAITASRSSAR